MSYKIAEPPTLRMDLLEPIEDAFWACLDEGIIPSKGRIAHKHIESRPLPPEHIREGQLPVQRLNALLTLPQPLQRFRQFCFQRLS